MLIPFTLHVETTGPARRQPDHIHMGRLTHLQTENSSVLVRREIVPNWYAAQSQKTDALPLSHGGSPSRSDTNRAVQPQKIVRGMQFWI